MALGIPGVRLTSLDNQVEFGVSLGGSTPPASGASLWYTSTSASALANACGLSVSANGNADLLISGDDDLLVVNPFRGIRINAPDSYLKR